MNYDEMVNKFKHGGRDKLEASHELIISVHDYIVYLTEKYYSYLYHNYLDDIINHCHLFLLDRIYQFNPDRGKFITWARFRILNGIATFYEKYGQIVKLPRHAERHGIRVQTLKLEDYNNVYELDYEEKEDLDHVIDQLHAAIRKKYPYSFWCLFRDYCGLNNDNKIYSLRQLKKKYNFKTHQKVHYRICKVIKFVQDSPELMKLLEKLKDN